MNRCVGCGDPTPNTFAHINSGALLGCCRSCATAANCYAGVLKATAEHGVGVDVDQEMFGALERRFPKLLHALGYLSDEDLKELTAPVVAPEPTPDVLPCLICGKQLHSAFPRDKSDDEQDMRLHGYIVSQPGDGTKFTTHGHYGSGHFDALYQDEEWEIAICTECLNPRVDRSRVLVRPRQTALSWAEYGDHERRTMLRRHGARND